MLNDIETRVTDLENRITALEKELHSVGDSPQKDGKTRGLSINEFLKEKEAIKTIDIVLAIAAYHERFNDANSFGANDLFNLIRKAKRKQPANINDLINKNLSKGYFEEDNVGDDGKKRWYVTNSGMAVVDNNFNRNEQNT